MNDNIHYKGKLKVDLTQRGTIVKTNHYTNKGTVNMFGFIGQCLAGTYNPANRPQYIRVFSAGTAGTDIDSLNINTILNDSSSVKSEAIIQSVPPRTSALSIDNLMANYDVTYKFMILDSQLTSKENINMFALYSDATKNNITQPLAYFYIISEEDDNKLGALDLTTSDLAIIIQWQVGISN